MAINLFGFTIGREDKQPELKNQSFINPSVSHKYSSHTELISAIATAPTKTQADLFEERSKTIFQVTIIKSLK